jgi:hypothetical protein
VGVIAAAALGCPFDSVVDPVVIPGRGGNGGGTGATTGASLAGTWRNLTAMPLRVTDTRWSFGAVGECSRTVVTTHLDMGIEETTTRNCRYTLSGQSVSIVFDQSTFVSTFSVAFSGGDLLLNGFRFQRIA